MPRKYKAASEFRKGDRLVIGGASLKVVKVGKPVVYGYNKKLVLSIWVEGIKRPHIYYVDTKLEYE